MKVVMDLLLDTVLKNASNVIGIMPTFLLEREISHSGLNELITVDNMSDRKAYMIEKGDAFIALPGGPGTLEGIIQFISWDRVGLNDCPCILVNINGYYDHLEKMFEYMVKEEFLSSCDKEKTLFSENLGEI
jgi:hypothetical protein